MEPRMPRTIGIIGGMSPESTVEYYRHIVHGWTERFDDHAYPEIVIWSACFADLIRWPAEGRWDLVAEALVGAARNLEAAGAEGLVIATNTMHRVVDEVRAAVSIPVLDIRDVVAGAILDRGLSTVGLLGTRHTMDSPMYPDHLAARGIRVLLPSPADRTEVDRIIYQELVRGELRPASRARYLAVIADLARRGAEGVILGCTEIPLLIDEQAAGIPLLDTTALHAEAALEWSIA